MPRAQSTGRAGSTVIPTDWETAPRAVLERTMRGRITLRVPGGTEAGWDEATQQTKLTPHAPYAADVPARVLQLSGEAQTIRTGEDTELVVDFRVAIPAGRSDVAAGHLVTVTETTDPLLVDAVLQVQHVGLGTERFERHLFCTIVD